MPPNILPQNSTGRLGKRVEKQAVEYVTQNTRHAVLRPYLSANWPTKYPETPPDRKPVVKSNATIFSFKPN
jgi:hypothetical protein